MHIILNEGFAQVVKKRKLILSLCVTSATLEYIRSDMLPMGQGHRILLSGCPLEIGSVNDVFTFFRKAHKCKYTT